MTTQYQCPHCAGLFQVDPSMSGGQVACPSCNGLVTVPGATAPAGGAAPSAIGTFRPQAQALQQVACAVCGNPLQVDASLAGQQAACPTCGALLTIPAPGPNLPSASPPAFTTPTEPLAALPSLPSSAPLTTTAMPQSVRPDLASPHRGGGRQLPQSTLPASNAPKPAAPRPAAPTAQTSQGSSRAEPRTGSDAQGAATSARADARDDTLDNRTVQAAWTPPGAADRTEEVSQRSGQDGIFAGKDRDSTTTTSGNSDDARADISHLMPPDFSSDAAPPQSTSTQPPQPGQKAQEPAHREPSGVTSPLPPHLDPVTGKPKEATDSPLVFTEPIKTIGVGEQQQELQTLTRKQKEGRRNLTSLIMFVVGFVVLSATLFILNMSSCIAIHLD